ncbi:hypothetical protein [Orenia marismortui]|uniref:hypothetical protein n=1 Tax=Orenia marismortui TaxID=46469 RepID=UPI000361077A|nr:hypothetical protein [Orenia marismortui]
MSNLGVAKKICRLQGIGVKAEIVVICPYCDEKQARISINTGKWSCSCGKHGKVDELYRVVESDYLLKDHKEAYWDTRNNKGVCR